MKKRGILVLAMIGIMITSFTACAKPESVREKTEQEPVQTIDNKEDKEKNQTIQSQKKEESERVEKTQIEGVNDENSAYQNVDSGEFTFEYSQSSTIQRLNDITTVFVQTAGDIPYYTICKIAVRDQSPEEFVESRMQIANELYGERITQSPELVTMEAGARHLTGYHFAYSTEDGMRIVTACEFVEPFDEYMFQYNCYYVSTTYVEGEHEDETTYFEFINAIETMKW